MTMDKLFLAFHVVRALMWVGSLFALMAFLSAVAGEPDPAARGRLLKHLREAAIVPDVGGTIAIVFGAHWLFRYKLYETTYMQLKLVLVVGLLALHVILKRKAGQAKRGQDFVPPALLLKPALTAIALGIVIFVITKVPV
ncbi:MAG: hypothetical protein NT062_17350 [Proteobacteria bacterium]|nr:hypothetical protein [Pseudomonadota bacterium]